MYMSEPITETYVMELSQSLADRVNANGDYVCHLAEPVTLRDGDELVMRMASIDSQKTTDTTVVIPEDLPLSMQFSYYDTNTFNDTYKTTETLGARVGPDFEKYLTYNERRILQLTSVQFVCPDERPPPDPYNPGTIVVVIPKFSWTDPDGVHRHSTPGLGLLDPYRYLGTAAGSSNIATCTLSGPDPIQYIEGSLSITGFFSPNSTNCTFVPNSIVFSVISAASKNLEISTAGIVLPAGRYERDTLAVVITKLFTEALLDPTAIKGPDEIFAPDTKLVFRTDDEEYESVQFKKMPDAPLAAGASIDFTTDEYVYNTGPTGGAKAIPSIQVGARKFAIEYGKAGNVFQLTAAHQSSFNSTSSSQENVAFYSTGTTGVDIKIYQVNASTGIVIHGLLPVEFWTDTLGLYDKLIVNLREDASNIKYYCTSDIIGRTPSESSTIPIFSNDNNRVISSAGGWTTDTVSGAKALFITTTETPPNAVLGNSPVVNSTGGFYLVEIAGLNTAQSNYVDNNQNRANISAIVSKQYNADDIVTGFADSSIPYVHRGAPIQITSANVRILDPETKEVDKNVGVNNTVFLQVTTTLPMTRDQMAAEKQK